MRHTTTVNHGVAAATPAGGRLDVRARLSAAWAWADRKREEARAIRHLREMDAHQLRDIGLDRSQIHGAVTGSDPDLRRGRG